MGAHRGPLLGYWYPYKQVITSVMTGEKIKVRELSYV
jgi:hypothetical protein